VSAQLVWTAVGLGANAIQLAHQHLGRSS
jgi:hypothetical protein